MGPKNDRLLTCDVCGKTFEVQNTDEEAKAAYEEQFGKPWCREEVAQVCSGCYYSMIAFSTQISTRRQ